MTSLVVLPLSQWLCQSRSENTEIAWHGDRRYKLKELRQNVTQLCQMLKDSPVQRWALCFDSSYRFTVALLALLHAGKTPVIPGNCRENVLREQHALFDAVLTDLPLSLNCPVLQVTDAVLAQPPQTPFGPLPPISEEAEVILFTSGSTGQPREVIKPVACLDREVEWLASLWGDRFQHGSVAASVTHQHLYGLTFRIMLPMALSLPFACQLGEYQEQIVNQGMGRRLIFISSPAFLKRLDCALLPPDTAFVLSAGGALHWQDAQSATQWFNQPICEIYGSTETGVLAWRERTQDEAPWHRFSGVLFKQENGDDKARLRVISPLIPEIEGLLLDDELLFLDDRRFHLGARRDRIVKIEEKRLSLSEIERRLCEQSEIAEAAIITVSRSDRLSIGAVVVLSEQGKLALNHIGSKVLIQRWRHALRLWLEPVAIPRYWRLVDAIPLNTQSKRAHDQLQELFHAAR